MGPEQAGQTQGEQRQRDRAGSSQRAGGQRGTGEGAEENAGRERERGEGGGDGAVGDYCYHYYDHYYYNRIWKGEAFHCFLLQQVS